MTGFAGSIEGDVRKDNLNPVWNHEAHFADFAVGDVLKFTIWDKAT